MSYLLKYLEKTALGKSLSSFNSGARTTKRVKPSRSNISRHLRGSRYSRPGIQTEGRRTTSTGGTPSSKHNVQSFVGDKPERYSPRTDPVKDTSPNPVTVNKRKKPPKDPSKAAYGLVNPWQKDTPGLGSMDQSHSGLRDKQESPTAPEYSSNESKIKEDIAKMRPTNDAGIGTGMGQAQLDKTQLKQTQEQDKYKQMQDAWAKQRQLIAKGHVRNYAMNQSNPTRANRMYPRPEDRAYAGYMHNRSEALDKASPAMSSSQLYGALQGHGDWQTPTASSFGMGGMMNRPNPMFPQASTNNIFIPPKPPFQPQGSMTGIGPRMSNVDQTQGGWGNASWPTGVQNLIPKDQIQFTDPNRLPYSQRFANAQ